MAQADAPQALLPAQAAASILGISLRTLREHVKAGVLPRVITGCGLKRKHYGFDPADIEAFKRARKEFGGQPCPSTNRRSRRSTPTISNSTVVGFMALRAQRASEKLKR